MSRMTCHRVVLALSFAVFVSLHLPIRGDEVVTPESVADEYRDLKESLEAEQVKLKPIWGSGLSAQCAGARAFTAASVRTLYKSLRERALAPVAAPEAAALKALLLAKFPKEPTDRSACFQAVHAIDEKAVAAFWKELTGFIGFAAERSKPMTVIVSASELEAVARLRPSAGGIAPAQKSTPGTFPKLFRGLYHLQVTKDGFAPFEADLGELADDQVRIHCKLARNGGAPSICAVLP